MQKTTDKHIIYFLGIGGIGISALARYFKARGCQVHGYDKTSTPLTQLLEQEGMKIHYSENISLIPSNIELVIYTPAVPTSNIEYQYFQKCGIQMLKRAEVLGEISLQHKTIACAGTHGKTTTSTLLAYLLSESEVGCNAFLGGISQNFESNLVLSESSKFLVTEADEYDRSFLQLHPFIGIITSIDADHLDIYKTQAAIEEAYIDFANQIQTIGTLLLKKGINLNINQNQYQIYSFSANQNADFYASNIRLENGLYHFDFVYPAGKILDLTLGIPGLYNIENAVAALAAATLAGATPLELSTAIARFKGVKRRFEIRLNTPQMVYIDDYAHHPEEINACITAAKAMFEGRKITGIFQPHLFSRTRDFAAEFGKSLSALDQVILLPIYPARELPIPDVDSEMLLDKIQNIDKQLLEPENIFEFIKKNNLDVLLTMGAGDIDLLVGPIENLLKQKYSIHPHPDSLT